MIMLTMPLSPSPNAYSGNIGRQPDANGATASRRRCAAPSAARSRPNATTTGGSPARSGGSESPDDFEGRQAMPPLGRGQTFCQYLQNLRDQRGAEPWESQYNNWSSHCNAPQKVAALATETLNLSLTPCRPLFLGNDLPSLTYLDYGLLRLGASF
jgi:hypothetical protein